jgi:hypothetical protein
MQKYQYILAGSMMRIRNTIMLCVGISLFFQTDIISKPPSAVQVKQKQGTKKIYKPAAPPKKPKDPDLEWKGCGERCLSEIFENNMPNIRIPFIKGFIKDMALQGEFLYLLVQDFNLITDAIFVIKRDSGGIKTIWGIGRHHAQAITCDGKSLWVLSRSNKYFLRKISLTGKGIGDIGINSLPEGAIQGLAMADGRIVFTINNGASSDIYSFDQSNKNLKKAFSFSGRISAITFSRNNLLACLNEFDTYRDRWLLIIDMKDGLKKKMCFVNADATGFASDQKGVYMLEKREAGARVYPLVCLIDKNIVLSNPLIRRIEVRFPLVSNNSSPYRADLWIPYPLDRDFQNVRKVVMEPSPREIVQDKYGNRWAHIRWERANASVQALLVFDILTSDAAFTIDKKRPMPGKDILREIGFLSLAETYNFDISNFVVRSHSTRIDKKGPLLSRVVAVRDYISRAVLYNANKERWSKASEYLFKGRGDAFGFSVSFAAVSRVLGIPARSAGGLLLDETESLSAAHDLVWSQVYFPGQGWIDIGAGGDFAGNHNHFACRSNRYFVTFEGDFDKADNSTIFTENDWRRAWDWSSIDPEKKADVELGRIQVKTQVLKE